MGQPARIEAGQAAHVCRQRPARSVATGWEEEGVAIRHCRAALLCYVSLATKLNLPIRSSAVCGMQHPRRGEGG
ncbi:hypothetical protein RI056_01580 [Komagataeibacter nataicola]|nr:hypothetical protein RI056_01580 [Komagataeibacter nataicola]